jgi:divalent metal cation (Fe/Co/Zn/Cd) transporter
MRWLGDTVCAIAVAAFVLALAFGLFRRAIPILVDRIAVEPEAVRDVARAVHGVRRVKTVRSRSTGGFTAIDMVVTVDSGITTAEAYTATVAAPMQLRDIA